jgi:predicted nucleic acid-binding protein
VIGYLDTSALVPMLIGESTSAACGEFWNTADAVTSSRLVYVESAAALARAERNGRFMGDEHRRTVDQLRRLTVELELIEVDERLVRTAADLAHRFALRGYDAVHCAAAAQLDAPDLVAASGDQKLLAAWRVLGVATFDPAGTT